MEYFHLVLFVLERLSYYQFSFVIHT